MGINGGTGIVSSGSVLGGSGISLPKGGVTPFVGLLDLYPSAAAAYSVRRLSSTYEGALIRVREDSGDTEADIGFDANGNLDTAALLAHCGVNSGFVVTWYDQSGNSNNATQSSAGNQPQIVSSGNVMLENGRPCLTANSTFLQSDNIIMNNELTSAQVAKATNFGFISDGKSAANINSILSLAETEIRLFNGTGIINTSHTRGNQELYTFLNNGASSSININNTGKSGSLSATDMGGISLFIAGNLVSNALIGSGQEFIFWDNANTYNNIEEIKSNINSYFSIYP
jgi:hypothetical protein